MCWAKEFPRASDNQRSTKGPWCNIGQKWSTHRRARPAEEKKDQTKTTFSSETSDYGPEFGRFFLEFHDSEKKKCPASVSVKPVTTKVNATYCSALSTSFEKTCMRQIHCLDRLSALVNKGPYHAQGLFETISDISELNMQHNHADR